MSRIFGYFSNIGTSYLECLYLDIKVWVFKVQVFFKEKTRRSRNITDERDTPFFIDWVIQYELHATITIQVKIGCIRLAVALPKSSDHTDINCHPVLTTSVYTFYCTNYSVMNFVSDLNTFAYFVGERYSAS